MRFAAVAVLAAGILAGGVLAGGQAHAASLSIENFESGGWGDGWSNQFGGAPTGTVNAAAAQEGGFGAADTGTSLTLFNLFSGYTLRPGDRLQAHVRVTTPDSGRFYLGFGGGSDGANSFVLSPVTRDIRFQRNDFFSFEELNTLPFAFDTDRWYLAEVFFAPGDTVIGSLFDADGTTLLAQLTAAGLTRTGGGQIAVRSFGGLAFDSIRVQQAVAPIPLPAAGLLLLGGLALMGAMARRRAA
jgi:hypothetical protein